MEHELKSEVFRLRLDRQTYTALREIAHVHERPMQNVLRVLIRQEARRCGLLEMQAQPDGGVGAHGAQ